MTFGSLPIKTNIIAQVKKNKNADKNKTINIENGIQIGEVTHHQDQLIVLVSFNTRKMRNNTVPTPTPPVVVSFDILFAFNKDMEFN